MEKKTNFAGEITYKWANNIHPDNPNFMQTVFWMAWVKKDGAYSIGYNLQHGQHVNVVERGTGGTEAAEEAMKKFF